MGYITSAEILSRSLLPMRRVTIMPEKQGLRRPSWSGKTKEEPVPHFFLLAYDGTDADAPARRKSARGAHFEGIKPMVERGELRAAGAILNDSGEMIGSAIFADFPSRAALDAWLDREPYVKQNVWQKIEVKPFRLAILDGKITP